MGKLQNAFWSGLLATGPMTMTLLQLQSKLNISRDKALPPAALTTDMLAPLQNNLSKERRIDSSLLSHFGFSVACAVIYSAFYKKVDLSPKNKGLLYGLGIWATSYLGWVPALGLRPAAKNVSTERNLQMMAAHVVWGISLAVFMDAFEKHGKKEWDGKNPATFS